MVAPPRASGGGASFSLLPRLRFWQGRIRAGCGMQMQRARRPDGAGISAAARPGAE